MNSFCLLLRRETETVDYTSYFEVQVRWLLWFAAFLRLELFCAFTA